MQTYKEVMDSIDKKVSVVHRKGVSCKEMCNSKVYPLNQMFGSLTTFV